MTGERDQPTDPPESGGNGPTRLRLVRGPVAADVAAGQPPIRLRREFKGLTVADMYREELVRRLPGQVRSALEHLERGDLAAADRALPGHFARIHEGPGHDRHRRRWLWFALVGVLAIVAGAWLAGCLIA